MKKRRTKPIMPWIAVGIWMGVIFFLSHQTRDESDTLSSGFTDQIRGIIKSLFPSLSLDMESLHWLIQKGLYVFLFLVVVFVIVYMFRFPKRKGNISAALPWVAILAWMAIFFSLTQQPGDESGEWGLVIAEKVRHIVQMVFPSMTGDMDTHHFIRKAAHFFAYMLLGVLLLHALRPSFLKGAVIAVIISVFYAVTDEIHQLFVPGRGGELRDVLIDGLGAATGVIFYLAVLFAGRMIFGRRGR